jgi:hypothetical protein
MGVELSIPKTIISANLFSSSTQQLSIYAKANTLPKTFA